MSDGDRRLAAELDDVARVAAGQIERANARDAARRAVGGALALTLLVPLVAVVIQLARLAAGAETAGFSWWLLPVAALPALLFIGLRFIVGRQPVSRRRALAAVDRRLASGDRLLTADEFLTVAPRSGFMTAAIEDAETYVARGREQDVTPAPAPIVTRLLQRFGVPAALAMLVLAAWLATIEPLASATLAADTPIAARVTAAEARAEDEIALPPDPAAVLEPGVVAERQRREDRTRARTNATVSKAIPEGAEQARGSMGVGETSESDQSSTPSNARGAPSSQGQPSRPGTSPPKKKTAPQTRAPDPDQEEQPRKKTEEPAGSTAGQGSSRGSNRNPAVSDWSNRDQVNTPDDDQVEEEEDVEDEEEEQESRGGLQPNLRDRRPPVNRDLRIGFGNRANPDANGRGGPSQQKKSRGVASFVLGVPIPDRVKGQPNPGKTRVTQQRIEPEPEQADPATAEARTPRSGPIGPVYHPLLDASLRALVRSYFLEQRREASSGSTTPRQDP